MVVKYSPSFLNDYVCVQNKAGRKMFCFVSFKGKVVRFENPNTKSRKMYIEYGQTQAKEGRIELMDFRVEGLLATY